MLLFLAVQFHIVQWVCLASELLNVFLLCLYFVHYALQCKMGLPGQWIAPYICVCACILCLYLYYSSTLCNKQMCNGYGWPVNCNFVCACILYSYFYYSSTLCNTQMCNGFGWPVNCSMSQGSRPVGCSSTHLNCPIRFISFLLYLYLFNPLYFYLGFSLYLSRPPFHLSPSLLIKSVSLPGTCLYLFLLITHPNAVL